MANNLQLDATIRNAQADAITTRVGASGAFKIYSGTPPANVAASLSGNTLLATLPCSATFAAAASAGVLTANAITSDTNAAATGTPTFYRLCQSGGTAVLQGTVGASGCDLNLSGLSSGQIIAGGTVACSSYTHTIGNA